MIWDRELDGAGPKLGVISEVSFWAWIVGVTIALILVENLVLIRLVTVFQIRFPGGLIAGLGLPNVLLARYLVGVVMRRRGLTRRDGKPATIITRTPLIPAGEPEATVVEVTLDLRLYFGVAIVCGLGAVFFGLMVLVSHGDWLAIGLTVFCVLAMIQAGVIVPWVNPRTTVDATGIWGYPRDLAIRRRFIPWSAIATVEVETIHNLNGKARLIRPILYDSAGRRIIRLDTIGLRLAEQEKLVHAIQVRLPRGTGGNLVKLHSEDGPG